MITISSVGHVAHSLPINLTVSASEKLDRFDDLSIAWDGFGDTFYSSFLLISQATSVVPLSKITIGDKESVEPGAPWELWGATHGLWGDGWWSWTSDGQTTALVAPFLTQLWPITIMGSAECLI